MADAYTALNLFIEENLALIVLIVGIPVGLLYLYKIYRKVPAQPDYIRVFKESMLWEEKLNKPDKKYGLKYIYRGKKKIGKILSMADGLYNVPRKSELHKVGRATDKGQPIDVGKERLRIFTVTFRPIHYTFLGIDVSWGKEILKYSEKDEFVVEDQKIIFGSDVSFTSLGQVYATLNSYQQISTTILDIWNKNLLQSNTNLYSSEMVKISAQTPQMAHELALKRLEIEKIKADKMAKLSNII